MNEMHLTRSYLDKLSAVRSQKGILSAIGYELKSTGIDMFYLARIAFKGLSHSLADYLDSAGSPPATGITNVDIAAQRKAREFELHCTRQRYRRMADREQEIKELRRRRAHRMLFSE